MVTILLRLCIELLVAKTSHVPQAAKEGPAGHPGFDENTGFRSRFQSSEADFSSCAFAARVVAGRVELAAKRVGPKPTFSFREWRFETR